MRVFVTGGTGFIGSAVVHELIGNGHQVVGLARSESAARSLITAGAAVHRGSVEDLNSLRTGASKADGVIHTAFFHKFSHASLRTRMRVLAGGSPRQVVARFLQVMLQADRQAIEALGTALTGADRPLVAAFGTMALSAGRLGTEDDDVDPRSVGGARGATETTMADLAARGVRTSVVRLPPVVHGHGDHGFLAQMITAARKHGQAIYADEGLNRWPTVHQRDAARLFVRALEHGEAGARYHGVAEEGIPVRDIAQAIGRGLGLPAEPATPQQITARLGFVAPFLGVDNPASSTSTQTRLGWHPTHRSLFDDLAHGDYLTGPA